MKDTVKTAMADKDFRVVVIGSGMSGILMGIRLLEAGITNFTIYEKAERLGGTWRENTYPGIACDVASHHYVYSFEPNPDWNHRYPPGEEIWAYFERVAKKYGVLPYIKFNTEVETTKWNGSSWDIETKDGMTDQADVLISASGVLHKPVYPEIEGLDTFKGDMFHTARWDHSVDLMGKNVGIIGTGSTASQIVPAIIDKVGKLSLFQRTAQWVFPLASRKYSNFEKKMFRLFPILTTLLYKWNFIFLTLGFAKAVIEGGKKLEPIHKKCQENLDTVKDPILRKKLTPDYLPGCKRLIFSDSFYDAIQKPNADLVTDDIVKIVPEGIITKDGMTHALDVLVLSTGFKPDAFMRPINMIGENGVHLNDLWADGPKAYHALSMPQMPNMFMIIGPHSPIGNLSLITISESQTNYIMRCIKKIRSEHVAIAPLASITDALTDEMKKAAMKTNWASGCNSWYLDKDGVPGIYPFYPMKFFKELDAGPLYEEYEVKPLANKQAAE